MIFRSETFVVGVERTQISLNDLIILPTFIRSDNIQLICGLDPQPVEEKCKVLEVYLLSLKSTLNESSVIEFEANISKNCTGHFKNHSHLLDHIQHQFLPICSPSRRYKFLIHFNSDANAVTNVIASILNLPELKRCSSAEIQICYGKGFERQQSQLPVEVISNWLKLGMEMNVRNGKDLFLKIHMDNIQNAQEMVDHLKMVSFIYF